MIIQLEAPKNSVTEWVVNYLSKKLVDLHRRHPQVTNAHVSLRKSSEQEKSCTIGLRIKGMSLKISRTAGSFSKACFFVLLEMESRLRALSKKQTMA